jgi:NDP-sugar pyrophosphorylase family protein
MLPIDGHPFLEYLVWQLSAAGIGTIVFSCGYRADVIQAFFGDGRKWKVEIGYSTESSPLGTGGATRLAAAAVPDDRFLLLNGDSICEVDCRGLLDAASGDILGVMTLTRVPDGRRYGSVELTADGRISAFRQNDPSGQPALVNAGVYALRKEILDSIPASGPSSLERDVLPRLVGRLRGVLSEGYFIDMGLPETYEQLRHEPQALWRAVRRSDHFG